MNVDELITMLQKLPEEYRKMPISTSECYNRPVESVTVRTDAEDDGVFLSFSMEKYPSVDDMISDIRKFLKLKSDVVETLKKAEREGVLKMTYEEGFAPDWFYSTDFTDIIHVLNGFCIRFADDNNSNDDDMLNGIGDDEFDKTVYAAMDIFRNKHLKHICRKLDKYGYRFRFSDFSTARHLDIHTHIDLDMEYDKDNDEVAFKAVETVEPACETVDGHNTYRIEKTYEWRMPLRKGDRYEEDGCDEDI